MQLFPQNSGIFYEAHIILGQSNAVAGQLSDASTKHLASWWYDRVNLHGGFAGTYPSNPVSGTPYSGMQIISSSGTRINTLGFGHTVFANTMAQGRPGRRIAILKCAANGTYSNQWLKASGIIYPDVYTTITGLIYSLESGGNTVSIRSVGVWQGETDTDTDARAASWLNNWKQIRQDLTSDLAGYINYSTPWWFARLPLWQTGFTGSTNPNYLNAIQVVRSGQQEIANEPYTIMVNTDDSDVPSDKVHATSSGYSLIYNRAATGIMRLMS